MIEDVSAGGIRFRDTGWRKLKELLDEHRGSKSPGVYLARHAEDDEVFYVGYAGKRGVRARLNEYFSGSDLNGLGVVVLDLALNDAEWLRPRLKAVEDKHPTEAVRWMKDAMERKDIQFSILFTDSPEEAKELEDEMIERHCSTLLNRAVIKRRNEPTNGGD